MSGDSLGQDKITEEFYEYKNIKFAMQRELDQVFIIRAPPELAIEGLGTEFWCSGNISAARTAWDLNDEGRKRYFLGRICKRGVLLWDIFILVTGKGSIQKKNVYEAVRLTAWGGGHPPPA